MITKRIAYTKKCKKKWNRNDKKEYRKKLNFFRIIFVGLQKKKKKKVASHHNASVVMLLLERSVT